MYTNLWGKSIVWNGSNTDEVLDWVRFNGGGAMHHDDGLCYCTDYSSDIPDHIAVGVAGCVENLTVFPGESIVIIPSLRGWTS